MLYICLVLLRLCVGPQIDGFQCGDQGSAPLGQGILHGWRYRIVLLPGNQTVLFKFSQTFRQHGCGDADHPALKLPVAEGLADRDGSIHEDTYQIYEELAEGGTGLIITGFTDVDQNDVYIDGMMRLSEDALIPQYQRLTDRIHKHDARVIAQLAMGAYYKDGRQKEPDEMSMEELQDVKDLFVKAAVRGREGGL